MSRFLNFRMTLGNDSSVILSSFKCQGKYGQLQYAARKKVRQSIFCVVRCHVPNCVGSKHRGSALSSPRRARGEVRQELQGLPVGDRAAATRAGDRTGARLGSQGRGWGPRGDGRHRRRSATRTRRARGKGCRTRRAALPGKVA